MARETTTKATTLEPVGRFLLTDHDEVLGGLIKRGQDVRFKYLRRFLHQHDPAPRLRQQGPVDRRTRGSAPDDARPAHALELGQRARVHVVRGDLPRHAFGRLRHDGGLPRTPGDPALVLVHRPDATGRQSYLLVGGAAGARRRCGVGRLHKSRGLLPPIQPGLDDGCSSEGSALE